MKVLIIGPFSPPISGVSFANETLLKNMQSEGIICDTINTNTSNMSSRQGTSFSFRKAWGFINTYLHLFKIFNHSVVYITPGQTFFGILKYAPFLLTCLLAGKPYIIHVHGNYLGKEYNSLTGLKKKIFHFLLSKSSAGIVLSKSLEENFKGLMSPEKIFVVNNFADNSLYNGPVMSKQHDQVRLLYLSNLMREKGILELLDALIELQKRDIPFKALIAGSMEKEISGAIHEKIQRVAGNVEYIGTVTGSRKKAAFANSNVFILPTYYTMEGQPISILEGLATGNIIITTKHAGIPDIINDSNGFLITPRSSEAIVDCIEALSRKLDYNIDKYSDHNRRYAALMFTESRFSKEIVSICKKALQPDHHTNKKLHPLP